MCDPQGVSREMVSWPWVQAAHGMCFFACTKLLFRTGDRQDDQTDVSKGAQEAGPQSHTPLNNSVVSKAESTQDSPWEANKF